MTLSIHCSSGSDNYRILGFTILLNSQGEAIHSNGSANLKDNFMKIAIDFIYYVRGK